jgi:UDP-N-acetylglucosamine diphosphorylase/glucosamine-1-phosphate N-acetyltransferase
VVGDQVAYVRLPGGEAADLTGQDLPWRLAGWKQTLRQRPAGGCMIDYPWDLVERNAEVLEQDGQEWCGKGGAVDRAEVPVVGPRERFAAHAEARIEPFTVIDTTRGPVLIDRGAVVQAFSRLEGPCYVGPETQVLGARVRGSSIGPQCRLGGEVEYTVIQGYSNKAHDGFLGHSCLGEWVNLGAGTQVSDLRVDYGQISVSLGGRKVGTGLIKVGAYLGDHTKTSVATLLNQGTVAGPFSLLLTSGGLMPRVLPPFCQFAHGRIQERVDLRLLFGTAATVMARRGRQWTAAHAELYFSLFDQTEPARRQMIRESEQRRLRRVV